MSRIFLYALLTTVLMACSEDPAVNDGSDNSPQEPQQSVENTEWTDVSDSFGTLPDYIKVLKSPDKLQDKKVVAYVAVADMTKATWDVWSIKDPEMDGTTDSYKRPSDVYDAGAWSIVINAGFFYSSEGKNYPASLAVRNSEVMAYNINYASEDWQTIYYPTRAAFIESESGEFDACWTYRTSDNHYMYPIPASNKWYERPEPVPSAKYPEGGCEFAAINAIGGGPLLIDNGEFKNTYAAELYNGSFGISPLTKQPRTAVGITSDKKMLFFVCEGRQMTQGVAGLSTADVARILLDLGCVEAINLDGGGSSCMLVNGKETIKVSDGSQRPVGSTIMIK